MFTKLLDEEIKIKELLKKDNPVIVECGSNQGRTTKGFLKCFPHIKLFCFEPDPRNIIKWKKNIQDSRCELFEAAVVDFDGEILLNLSGGHRPGESSNFDDTDSSTIKGTENHVKLFPWINYDKSIKVKAIKLDTWRKEHKIGDIDFIWADVEGAEENMLGGAQETLRHTHYIYTEFSNNEAYNGQINLQEIQRMLPRFVMVKCWTKDVLFRNKLWK